MDCTWRHGAASLLLLAYTDKSAGDKKERARGAPDEATTYGLCGGCGADENRDAYCGVYERSVPVSSASPRPEAEGLSDVRIVGCTTTPLKAALDTCALVDKKAAAADFAHG